MMERFEFEVSRLCEMSGMGILYPSNSVWSWI